MKCQGLTKVIIIHPDEIWNKLNNNFSQTQPHGGAKSEGITKIIRMHPLGTMNACIKK